MALSKSTRILILLAIDSAFFLLELITGYTVHSLALVADSFHMLNDVLSLCVGFWAVRVASRKTSQHQLKTYTYGWQRAETLGALVNGVFLVALCVTIFLDAIQRFVEPQVVSNPQLVLIVGCLGLASNLVGLVLFHDHSHSHGPGGHSHAHGHDHEHTNSARDAEEGRGHVHSHTHDGDDGHAHSPASHADAPHTAGSDVTAVDDAHSPGPQLSVARSGQHAHSRSRSQAYSSPDNVFVGPNAFRRSIIEASNAQRDELEFPENSAEDDSAADDEDDTHTHARQPLLNGRRSQAYGATQTQRKSIDHGQHKHSQPKEPSAAHGHSHADLNMRGIFLHVMGDALGNVGVIATALIIWLTDVPWRFYFDPAISLVITCIILASAIPLCKAASRILLQAVPAGLNVDDVRADIEEMDGILSCHHLHVWQLSDTKLVASLHVQLAFDLDADGSTRYMELAQAVRKCLHEYGIHSSTIQPEFCLDPAHDHSGGGVDGAFDSHVHDLRGDVGTGSRMTSKAGSVREPDACLLECGDECGGGMSCCEPVPKDPHQAGQHQS